MATSFPTSIDSLVNPTGSDYQNGAILHSAQHANANDAIEALQTKVGINSSADTSSIDYLLKNPSSSNPGHVHTVAAISDYTTATDTRADNRIAAKRGAANGVASLNSSTKIPVSEIAELTTAQFAANVIDTDATLAANSSTRLATQSAIKAYVDNMAANISWKPAVRVATTTNGTLATAFADGQVVDGITLATGDRILIKNQSTATENGLYEVQASGAPVRVSDANTGAELLNATVMVRQGTANANTQWTCSNSTAITIGSTNITFAQIAGAGVYTNGNGITLTGNAFSIANNAITNGLLRQSAGLSVIGRSANSTGDVADITAASNGQVMRRSGTTIGFGAVDLASANAVTGSLPLANGGTGGTTAATARTNLGLGTAATANTGTSGATVPLLDGNNTHSGNLTVSGTFTTSGTTVGTTQSTLNNTTSLATTAFAQGLGLRGSSQIARSANYTFADSDRGAIIVATASHTVTLPLANTAGTQAKGAIMVAAVGRITFATSGSDTITQPFLENGDSCYVYPDGGTNWRVISFGAAQNLQSLAANGYKFQGGSLIEQWMAGTVSSALGALGNASQTVTYPLAMASYLRGFACLQHSSPTSVLCTIQGTPSGSAMTVNVVNPSNSGSYQGTPHVFVKGTI